MVADRLKIEVVRYPAFELIPDFTRLAHGPVIPNSSTRTSRAAPVLARHHAKIAFTGAAGSTPVSR